MACESIELDGKGGNTLVMRIGQVRDAVVCPSTACVRQDFSEVMQQCSLGSPELSLKALMAYPDVKIVASFVHRCLREAVPP
jgi:hypothetical protein